MQFTSLEFKKKTTNKKLFTKVAEDMREKWVFFQSKDWEKDRARGGEIHASSTASGCIPQLQATDAVLQVCKANLFDIHTGCKTAVHWLEFPSGSLRL